MEGGCSKKAIEGKSFCGSYGGYLWDDGTVSAKTLSLFSQFYGEIETKYHRRRFVSGVCRGLDTVKCSESSWIAVNGVESMCVITRDTAKVVRYSMKKFMSSSSHILMYEQVKSEKPPDLLQIFSNSAIVPSAVVSVILGTNELGVGNGIADSEAEYYEISAIDYLEKKLMKKPDLTYDQTLQTAITAYQLLLRGNINADQIKICVGRKSGKKTRSGERIGKPSSITILPTVKVNDLILQAQQSETTLWAQ